MGTIAANVLKRRTAAGWTQEKLSSRAKLSIRVITSLEQGDVTDPRISSLLALAGALGCTVNDLLVGSKTSLRKRGRR
jgi:transcriptional regulator with XRE-family HTH domain